MIQTTTAKIAPSDTNLNEGIFALGAKW